MKRLLATLALIALPAFAVDPVVGSNALINGALDGSATGWTISGAPGGVDGAGGPGYTFSFSTGTIAQTYAINEALRHAGTGIQVHGFNYGFEYRFNCGQRIGTGCESNSLQDTLNATVTITNDKGSTIYSQYYGLGSKNAADGNSAYNPNWQNVATEQRFSSPYDLSNLGTFTMSITGMDAGFWGGNYGPNVRNAYSHPVYGMNNCAVDPLSSTTCPGYETAYKTQQCAISALYDPTCPGYAAAYFTQQCSMNPLHDVSCPGYATAYYNYQCSADPLYHTGCAGYAEAYLNQQCLKDSLYSTKCEGYATAYAIKYLVGLDSSVTSAVNSTLTNTVETQRNDPANTTGVTDATVSTVIATPATTSTTSVAPTAVISVARPQSSGIPNQAEKRNDDKKDDVTMSENKNSRADNNEQGNRPRTTREEIAQQQTVIKDKEAVAKGKEQQTTQVGRAPNLEAQIAVQSVVVQAMNFVPGFDTYNRATLPDSSIYKPFTVYNNQRNVDTPAGRGLFGRSDKTHDQMVDAQYNLGN
jgi:hypothetical protein